MHLKFAKKPNFRIEILFISENDLNFCDHWV